ncbi:MAG TPA: arsenate reductase ArsC [Frankiaceae bacterium]|nr:arsenate reductase ArsC [Frankiaceae bacterium]
MTDPTPTAHLRRIADKLAYDYDACFSTDEVLAMLHDSYDQLAASASVTAFLPVLAERLTRERLDARAQVEGKLAKRVPEVLFVCVQNAGRSQMAAALARHYAGSQLHIRTGGSAPGHGIHPPVVQAMKEIGLSMDQEFPKPLTDEVVRAADVVVTMGCGDECPYVPGRRYEDWPIADPAHADADAVTVIRDDIDRRVRSLLADLLPGFHPAPGT